MLEHISRQHRSLLSLSLTSLALMLAMLAFCTSYWCEGTHKVVKPLCLSPVKMKCKSNNSQPYTTEISKTDHKKESLSLSPSTSGATSPQKKEEEQEQNHQRQLANAVHYMWETGEDKYMLRYFHTGFWLSCEKHNEGEKCRSFIDLAPGETQGVLWLSMVSEFLYIGLLAAGFLLMWLEVLYECSHKEMCALKVNSFAAICTVLSGLIGMVAHMMYTTVFQMTVSVGPEDWKPQSWDYGWSFVMAWISFSCCMAAAVLTLNSYTKTIVEMRHRQKKRLDESYSSHVPIYSEAVQGGGIYSVHSLLQYHRGSTDPEWAENEEGKSCTLFLIGEGGKEGCVDCEKERGEIDITQTESTDSVC
ncbi:germ cell-specific gene 1-like protein [Arapaima gigas]